MGSADEDEIEDEMLWQRSAYVMEYKRKLEYLIDYGKGFKVKLLRDEFKKESELKKLHFMLDLIMARKKRMKNEQFEVGSMGPIINTVHLDKADILNICEALKIAVDSIQNTPPPKGMESRKRKVVQTYTEIRMKIENCLANTGDGRNE